MPAKIAEYFVTGRSKWWQKRRLNLKPRGEATVREGVHLACDHNSHRIWPEEVGVWNTWGTLVRDYSHTEDRI